MNTPTNAEKPVSDWNEISKKIKAKWNKLTEVDIEAMKGNLHLLSDKVQKAYGYTKEKAEEEFVEFKKHLESTMNSMEKKN